MEFEKILKELTPKLRGISRQLNNSNGIVDEDDIIQEMSIYLWVRWGQGKFEGCTSSYILQGCWFHAKNYIRKNLRNTVSLDDKNDEEYASLAEKLPDESHPLLMDVDESISVDDRISFEITLNRVKDCGLTDREKEILSLTLEGYTLREIGKMVNVSFVMVSKILKNIRKKTIHIADLVI